MLAVWTDYLQSWQLFVIVPLVLAWIIGGGLAIGYGLRRATGSKRLKPAQGVLATLLATLVAGFAVFAVLLVTLQVGNAIRGASGGGAGPFIVIGVVLGGMVGLVAAFFVYLSMFSASARQVLKAITVPILAMIVTLGAAAGLSYSPTVSRTLDKRHSQGCQNNLQILCSRLGTIEDPVTMERLFALCKPKEPHIIPAKLADLSEEGKKLFICPSHEDREMGFVFCFDKTANAVNDLIVVADKLGNHINTVNVITMTRTVVDNKVTGRVFQVVSMTREQFESRLKEDVNAAFAKEYEAATK